MRNALQPTVSVIGTAVGYLFGGLVALELIFNYPGLGSLIYTAAHQQGHPAPVRRRHPGRHHLHGLHAGGRPDHRVDEPPSPARSREVLSMNVPLPDPSSAAAVVDELAEAAAHDDLVTAEVPPGAAPIDTRAERRQARKERLQPPHPPAGVHHRRADPGRLAGVRHRWLPHHALRPAERLLPAEPPARHRQPHHGDGPARARRAVQADGRGAGRARRRTDRRRPQRRLRHVVRPADGLLPRLGGRRARAASSRPCSRSR